jgi:hypothetical protein
VRPFPAGDVVLMLETAQLSGAPDSDRTDHSTFLNAVPPGGIALPFQFSSKNLVLTQQGNGRGILNFPVPRKICGSW